VLKSPHLPTQLSCSSVQESHSEQASSQQSPACTQPASHQQPPAAWEPQVPLQLFGSTSPPPVSGSVSQIPQVSQTSSQQVPLSAHCSSHQQPAGDWDPQNPLHEGSSGSSLQVAPHTSTEAITQRSSQVPSAAQQFGLSAQTHSSIAVFPQPGFVLAKQQLELSQRPPSLQDSPIPHAPQEPPQPSDPHCLP
jgi:hypothetical protein